MSFNAEKQSSRGRGRSPSAPSGRAGTPCPPVGRVDAPSSPRRVKLGEVCEIIGGGTPSKKVHSYYEGDIPWASVRDMNCRFLSTTEFRITQKAVDESATNIIPAGEVVISTHVGLGKVCILTQDTAINQDLKAIIPHGDIDRSYLYFWFASKAKDLIAAGKGATVKGVTVDYVKNLQIPLPPLPAQREIAAELDRICELKRTAEKLVEKYQQLVKSRFVEMFGLDGATETPHSGECGVSSHHKYPVVTVGDVFQVGGPKRIHQSEWQDHGVPF